MKVLQLEKKFFFFTVLFCCVLQAQQAILKGKIIDVITKQNLSEVTITIEETMISSTTNFSGEFNFMNAQLPLGEQIIRIAKVGYKTKRFPIVLNEGVILDLKEITLEYDFDQEHMLIGTINLSDNELDDGEDTSFNVSGLLQASKDTFLKAAAYDFSATFFRPRGLGNENGKVLINGIEMNTFFDGRPKWSSWGGLNDVQRNQEFSMGLAANDYTFGDLSGTTNIIMRASQYRQGGRISYASSNRSYTGRVMGTYSSGLTKGGWAYAASISRRYGNEGLIDGTLYDANSIFVAVEKKINDQHSLNVMGFYTPNRRGKSTAITEEVFQLKGRNYNPNWGFQDSEKRNSRIQEIHKPVVMLNHYWDISSTTSLNTNLAFQKGNVGNSRIDTGGTDLVLGPNEEEIYMGGGSSRATNPMHPKNLPSYYLQYPNPTPLDFQNAFLAQQQFTTNGQLDWDSLVYTNQSNAQQGNNATYILYEDKTDDIQYTANMIFNSQISDKITLNTAVNYTALKSENYAQVLDLLGGTGFLDVDMYAQSTAGLSSAELADRAQSDLRNRNRVVGEGDRFDYNYEIKATTINGFAQAQCTFKKIDFFLGGKISRTAYQRKGLYENGYFKGSESFGKGEALDFQNYGVKAGVTYKINGRNWVVVHGSYFTKPPTIRNAFANARQNNMTIAQLVGGTQKSEKIQSIAASYVLRTPKLKAKLTGYYTTMEEGTEISFFFTEAIAGTDTGFVQEILTDIDKLHIGGELGIEYQITPTIKLKAAAAAGQFTYDNNPELILTSTSASFDEYGGVMPLGKSSLKHYKIAGGPQRATQLGIEYRDPDFWWFGATANYFSNAYLDINSFARTTNFYKDEDGLPFNNYEENIAKELLKQERFDDYALVNIVGGKSWKIKGYYIGFFATVSNIFNKEYKTGGFEQARRVNYRSLLAESERETPVFGSRYFYGYSTAYYLNAYIRF